MPIENRHTLKREPSPIIPREEASGVLGRLWHKTRPWMASLTMNIPYIPSLIQKLKEKQYSMHVMGYRRELYDQLYGDESFLDAEVRHYFSEMPFSLEMYTIEEDEPAHIRQMKKVLNALNHIELFLTKVEMIDLKKGTPVRRVEAVDPRRVLDKENGELWLESIEHLQQACFIISQPEFQFEALLSGRINFIQNIFKEIKGIFLLNGVNGEELSPLSLSLDAAASLGKYAGIGVGSLREDSFDLRMIFKLTQALPSYIENYTTKVQALLPKLVDDYQVIKRDRSMNIEQRMALLKQHTKEALAQVEALINVDGSDVSVSSVLFRPNNFFPILKLFDSIKASLNDISGAFENSGEETHTLVKMRLAQLKEEKLVALLSGLDKIELELAILAPGTISQPVLKQMEKLYDVLIGFAERFVKFKPEEQHLKTLNNSRFAEKRMQLVWEMHSQLLQQEKELERERVELQAFFVLLDPSSSDYLINLSRERKLELSEQYKLIRGTVQSLSVEFDQQIVEALTSEASRWDRVYRLGSYLPTTYVTQSIGLAKTVYRTYQLQQEAVTPSALAIEDELPEIAPSFLQSYVVQPAGHLIKKGAPVVGGWIYSGVSSGVSVAQSAWGFIKSKWSGTSSSPVIAEGDVSATFEPASTYPSPQLSYRSCSSGALALTPASLHAKQTDLQHMLSRALATNQFCQNYYQRLAHHLYQDLPLDPWVQTLKNPLFLNDRECLARASVDDERRGLAYREEANHCLLTDEHFNQLRTEQLSVLLQAYGETTAKFSFYHSVHESVTAILSKGVAGIRVADLLSLKEAYIKLQPWLFFSAENETELAEIIKRDRIYTSILNDDTRTHIKPEAFRHFLRDVHRVGEVISRHHDFIMRRFYSLHRESLTRVETTSKEQALTVGTLKKASGPSSDPFSRLNTGLLAGLGHLTQSLSPTLRLKLLQDKKDKGIPFPELDDPLTLLKEPSQLVWIKKLYNVSHSLERLSREYQSFSLNENTPAITFGVDLYRSIYSIREIYTGLRLVMSDPYLLGTYQTSVAEIQRISAAWKGIQQVHLMDSGAITAIPRAVQRPAIWYLTLNLLMIPSQIKALKDPHKKLLSSSEILSIQTEAKALTLRIEDCIPEHNDWPTFVNYLYHFVQLGTYKRVGQEVFVERMGEFRHAISNLLDVYSLKRLNTHIFETVLSWCDALEMNYGLRPALLSRVVEEHLSTARLHFVENLPLTTRHQIQCLTDNSQLTRRREKIRESLVDNIEAIARLKTKILLLEGFSQYMSSFMESAQGPAEIEAFKQQFNAVYAMLKEAQSEFSIQLPILNCSKEELEHTFRTGFFAPTADLKQLAELSALLLLKLQGELTTKEMDNAAYEERMDAFDKELGHHEDKTLLYKQQAIQKLYDKLSEHIIQKASTPLTSLLDQEFKKVLRMRFAHYKKGICAEINAHEDRLERSLESSMFELMEQRLKKFDGTYQKYLRMDAILQSLNQMDDYLTSQKTKKQRDFYESTITLNAKKKLLAELHAIVKNEALPIETRLKQLTDTLRQPQKALTFMCHRNYEFFTFNWLKQVVTEILDYLGLYTPQYKRLFNELSQALQSPQKTGASFFNQKVQSSYQQKLIPEGQAFKV